LTPYAVWFRYPADVMEPPKKEVVRALQQSEAIVTYILGLLPTEVQPQTDDRP
jgi:hypothetical protein